MSKAEIHKIRENLFLLRFRDEKTKYFEANWYIPEGITYNAYLYLGNKKILFDGWKYTYTEEFIETVKRLVNPGEIDYIILHHLEPDHSGSISGVLNSPGFKAEVLTHPLGRDLFVAFYGDKPKFREIKEEETMLGDKKIQFFSTPWLHWPETVMSYFPEEGVLFSGDAFGGYSLPEEIFAEEKNIPSYFPFARKYLVNVIGHFRDWVIKHIEKLKKESLRIKIIAPGHGLLWKDNPQRIISAYLEWAKATPREKKLVVVYSSMYGGMERAINFTLSELRDCGYHPKVFKFTDKQQDALSEILGEAIDAQGLIIGLGVYENNLFPPMRCLLELLIEKVDSEKPILFIGSYLWSRIAKKKIEEMFSHTKFNILEIIEFKGKLSEAESVKIREAIKKISPENFS
ncbi:MAG: FprA family A-type flavoprotein [Candidatus Omnitrophica bacterium]|nr:FprA family A-type flavoprotein [Candidatus Omnitrophota bacterium]MCM8793239.1 FprA family A-type flavoprotein [Candidatus Omnitrophota bacterium]